MFQYISYKWVRLLKDEGIPHFLQEWHLILSKSVMTHQVRLLVMPASPSSGPARAGTGSYMFQLSLIHVSWRETCLEKFNMETPRRFGSEDDFPDFNSVIFSFQAVHFPG